MSNKAIKEQNEVNVFYSIKAGIETFTKLREATGLSSRGLCLVLDRLLETRRIIKENDEQGRGIYKISEKHQFSHAMHEDLAKIQSNSFDYSAALRRMNEANDYYPYLVCEIKILIFSLVNCTRVGIQYKRSGLEINGFLGMIVAEMLWNILRRLKEEKDERKREIKRAKILKALKKIEREIKSKF